MKAATVQFALAVLLLTGIVASGVALVTAKHQSRGKFAELQSLQREQDRLLDDWSALSIEVGMLANHANIDEFARTELRMVEPGNRLQFLWIDR